MTTVSAVNTESNLKENGAGHGTAAVKMTRIQKLIAQRMLKSKRSKPCFYIGSKIDTTEMFAIRPRLRKSLKAKITTNAFYIRALALAVEKYPLMAGVLNGDYIRIADSINIGFAVNTPQGLVVPVVKKADTKTLVEIARLEKTLTEKARSNKLTLSDMECETVALSNLGAYGIDSFFGIVPPPASTILAVGNPIRTPVPDKTGITERKITTLTLAVDNRIADECYAARFLGLIKDMLQNPQKII